METGRPLRGRLGVGRGPGGGAAPRPGPGVRLGAPQGGLRAPAVAVGFLAWVFFPFWGRGGVGGVVFLRVGGEFAF